MSKIVKNLDGVSESRGQKFTKALQSQSDNAKESKQEKSETGMSVSSFEESLIQSRENTIVLNKNIWYLSIICVAFMGFIALVLSFKAFAQIQRGHTNVVKLSKVILKQHADIEKLNTAILEMRQRQSQTMAAVRKYSAAPSVSELNGTKLNNFSAELENLKREHQRLLSKLVDLNSEVKQLRTEKYSKN